MFRRNHGFYLLLVGISIFSESVFDARSMERLLGPEEEGVDEDLSSGMQAHLDEDIHYHPGIAGHEETLFSDLSATFLSAPEWSTQEMYNEESYEAYYGIRNEENTQFTDLEIEQVLSRHREGREQGEDGISAEEQALEEAMKKKRAPSGVRAMCYSLGGPQLLERCKKAANWGSGVIVQMNDAQNSFLEYGPDWYEAIAQLKSDSGLEITGMFFGAPNWVLLEGLLAKYGGVFDRVQINVEGREGACITQLHSLAESGVMSYGKPISYLAKGEDPDACKTSQGFRSEWDLYVNHPARDIKLPTGISIEFPCYDGHEGKCFRAFSKYAEVACDESKQRYVFAPYDRASNRMLHLYNEACLGHGLNLPPHDVVQAI